MPERGPRTSGTEQPADPADIKAVGYGPDDPVLVPERYAHLPVFDEQSGSGDRWNPSLMAPEPSSVYRVDRYLFVTDRAGRVVHAEGWLDLLPTEKNAERRNLDAQRDAGEPDRQHSDDGGHIFATSFNGPGEAINLTAQSKIQNQAVKGSDNWRQLEEVWHALRVSGVQVHASIDLRYPDASSRRPASRTVVDRHDGKRSPRRIFKETTSTRTRER